MNTLKKSAALLALAVVLGTAGAAIAVDMTRPVQETAKKCEHENAHKCKPNPAPGAITKKCDDHDLAHKCPPKP